jgi:general secretion pathway protein D
MTTNRLWVLTLVLLLPALAPAADEPATTRAGASARESNIQFIDINEIIARVAKKTGKQFIVDPRVRADVPLIGLDVERIDYDRLLAILFVHQFAAFQSGGAIIVIPDVTGRQMPIPVTTGVAANTPDYEWVTLLLQAKNVCAAQTVPVLRPLMPQAAHLAALPQTNTLLLMDHAANARRIADLFERLDKQAAANKQSCGESKLGSS